ncbi:MAG: hypothetical protein IIY88_03060 [Eubacterium sp.]|nr:hypothetical protein [Eubacterium sp.]
MTGTGKTIDERERRLAERLEKLEKLEAEVKDRERALLEKEKKRKQVILRIPSGLWEELSKWADDDLRSINGQIEYLLTKCVRERKKNDR